MTLQTPEHVSLWWLGVFLALVSCRSEPSSSTPIAYAAPDREPVEFFLSEDSARRLLPWAHGFFNAKSDNESSGKLSFLGLPGFGQVTYLPHGRGVYQIEWMSYAIDSPRLWRDAADTVLHYFQQRYGKVPKVAQYSDSTTTMYEWKLPYDREGRYAMYIFVEFGPRELSYNKYLRDR